MKKEIVKDVIQLRKYSEACTLEESKTIVQDLIDSINSEDLGLAAPQIGYNKRVFLANIPQKGMFVFINPLLTHKSPAFTPSVEGCLSLPGIQRCVSRMDHLKINADHIYKVVDGNLEIQNGPLNFNMLDAFIIQHELDHLDGILIIDKIVSKTKEQIRTEKLQKKQEKSKIKKVNNSNQLTVFKESKKDRKRRERALEIQERYLLQKQGLI